MLSVSNADENFSHIPESSIEFNITDLRHKIQEAKLMYPQIIPIVFATNNNYVSYCGVAIESIMQHLALVWLKCSVLWSLSVFAHVH